MQADLHVGLKAAEAAVFVGMSRRAWGALCANGGAPEAHQPFGKKTHPRWSRHELAAWVASGYPKARVWRETWATMLANGSWAGATGVIHVC